MPGHGATWSKFGACKEVADLLERSTLLQGKTHQAGNHVVEADQFSRTVRALQAKEDLGWMFVVMHADVERALSGYPDPLCGMGVMPG